MDTIPFTEEHKKMLMEMQNNIVPHSIAWDKEHSFFHIILKGNSVTTKIHWFEHAMTYLTDDMYDKFYANMEKTKRPMNILEKDMFYVQVLALKTIHPIEYLYKHFKTLKI